MIRHLVLSIFSVFMTSAFAMPLVPNPRLTTGDLCDVNDRDYSGDRYEQKIAYCRRNVTWETKTKIYEEYGIPMRCHHEYTIDHFIPLSIGGSNDPSNLWPEHKKIKATRPDFEDEIFAQVSEGRISQAQAVEIVRQKKMRPPVPAPSSNCERNH